MRIVSMALAIATAIASGAILAHGDAQHPQARRTSGDAATAFGHPGDVAKVTRTIDVTMTDAMRFSPAKLEIRKGETIRFVVRNDGKLLHEMVLGTDDTLQQHAAMMRKFPEMEHAEAYMVHVKPGTTGELIWTFDKPGRFGFACLVAGHSEAGMKGTVEVK